ncbi:hypothetical protein ABPG72_014434 [Tetrahymena utriculariae]
MQSLESRARNLLRQFSNSSSNSSSFSVDRYDRVNQFVSQSSNNVSDRSHSRKNKENRQMNGQVYRQQLLSRSKGRNKILASNSNNNSTINQSRIQRECSISKSKKNLQAMKKGSILQNKDSSPSDRIATKNRSASRGRIASIQKLYREKVDLKTKIMDMEEQIEIQKKKIKLMKELVKEEQKDKKSLTKQIKKQEEIEGILEQLHNKIKNYQENEIKLMQELNEQQKIARESLQKLYNFQEEAIHDKEAQIQLKNLQEKYNFIEQENRLLNEKNQQLSAQIMTSSQSNSEIFFQNEQLKKNLEELKSILKEKGDLAELEISSLRKNIEKLKKTNEYLQNNNNRDYSMSTQERDQFIIEIESLRSELEEKDRIIIQKENTFREQLAKINTKVVDWQNDLSKLKDLESENIYLKNKLNIYKDKLFEKQNKYKLLKQQWNEIYTDLISQIQELKDEMELIKSENKNFLSNYSAFDSKKNSGYNNSNNAKQNNNNNSYFTTYENSQGYQNNNNLF